MTEPPEPDQIHPKIAALQDKADQIIRGEAGMTAAKAAQLRAPFPPEKIGKLPKGGNQLDYVGHSAVTDRLLQVDPTWTWEPVAFGPDGLPAITTIGKDACLWIRLTVCGVTRLGVGTCAPGSGDLSKQLVSDALRNAAMRFGVALDLWSKEDLQHAEQAPKRDEPTYDVAGMKRRIAALDDHLKAQAKELFGWPPKDVPAMLDWLDMVESDMEPFD